MRYSDFNGGSFSSSSQHLLLVKGQHVCIRWAVRNSLQQEGHLSGNTWGVTIVMWTQVDPVSWGQKCITIASTHKACSVGWFTATTNFNSPPGYRYCSAVVSVTHILLMCRKSGKTRTVFSFAVASWCKVKCHLSPSEISSQALVQSIRMWTLMIYSPGIRCKRGLLEFSPSGAVMKSAQTDKVQTTDIALFESPHHPKPTVHPFLVTNEATAQPVYFFFFCVAPAYPVVGDYIL